MAESSQNRKDQIFETAALLFREKGYAATSVRDIAQVLGIEASSLYSHIKSKEEILEQICFLMASKFLDAIDEVNDIYFNAEEKLRMAIRNHVFIITENMDKAAVFLHEWRSLSEPRLSDFKKLRDAYENEFRVILQDGENEDVFAAVDKKFAVLTILSALNWIHEWYRGDGPMQPDEIATKLSDFIMSGLRKKWVTDPDYKP